MVNGGMEGFNREPQAEFTCVGVPADFHDDNFRLIFSSPADQTFDMGQCAGQIEGQPFVGCSADDITRKHGVGHHTILEAFFHIGDRTLQQKMHHSQKRKPGCSGFQGIGQGLDGRRGCGGIGPDITGDGRFSFEPVSQDTGNIIESNNVWWRCGHLIFLT